MLPQRYNSKATCKFAEEYLLGVYGTHLDASVAILDNKIRSGTQLAVRQSVDLLIRSQPFVRDPTSEPVFRP